MKSKIKNLIGITIIVSALVVLLTINASAETMYVSGAETGQVYLRTGPCSDSYYLLLSNGTAVDSIGWVRGWDGIGYNQVTYGGYTGWITSKYLSPYYTTYSPSYSWYNGYIAGASTGRVYFWSGAYGDGFITTIPNWTNIRWSTRTANGRRYCYWNGQYGWLTDAYVYTY